MAADKPFIPVAKPVLDRAEADAPAAAILSGWVTQGPQVAAFEREFADFVGAPHACAVSSGTAALHLALLAVGVKPGDEVITVSHSFIATANAIRHCAAKPVFADIEPGTFNIDVRRIEPLIGPRTKAILCVHQLGMPCALHEIIPIARRHDLALIEDAACAVGSEIHRDGAWERIGKPHADIACFSFHPRKLLTTGDGGMLTTGDAVTDRRVRLLRQHGMSVPDSVRHSSDEVIFEDYVELGYNYRLTDIQAAVGREQLKRLPGLIEQRRALAERYRQLLADIPGLRLPVEPAWARSNWQSFCVRLPEGADQRRVMQSMLDAGIATRRGVMCAHREPAYPPGTWSCRPDHPVCDCEPGRCVQLSESERAQGTCIILPLFTQMTAEQQARVAAELRKACNR